jgi:invasion protein IalB
MAVAMVVLYVVLGAPAPAWLFAMVRGQARIAPGFIGVANFGQWRLICVPGPPSLDGLAADSEPLPQKTQANARKVNACRINQEMPAPQQGSGAGQGPGQVIIAANFSLVGEKRMPAAMLRLPSTARAGDTISLRFDDGAVVNTTVRDCAATECVAAGTLNAQDWEHLSQAKSLQVIFPAAGGQPVLLDLPVNGLSKAMAALDRAEVSLTD